MNSASEFPSVRWKCLARAVTFETALKSLTYDALPYILASELGIIVLLSTQ